MDGEVGESWHGREPAGVLGRHALDDPPCAGEDVLTSPTDVDPVLRRVSEGGATPL